MYVYCMLYTDIRYSRVPFNEIIVLKHMCSHYHCSYFKVYFFLFMSVLCSVPSSYLMKVYDSKQFLLEKKNFPKINEP